MSFTLKFDYGGFFGGYKTFKIRRDGTACFQVSPPYELEREEFEVDDEHIITFKNAIGQLGVWDWKNEYLNSGVCDGVEWELKLKDGKRKKSVVGYHLFPDEFSQFIACLNDLVGRKIFDV